MKSLNRFPVLVRPKFNRLLHYSLRLIAACALLVSCKPVQPPNTCKKDFEVVLEAKKVKDGRAYFSMDQLAFLFTQSNFTLTDVDLIVTVDGERHKDIDFDIGFNGIKSSRRDGNRCSDRSEYRHHDNRTESHIPIHKFYLNGAESFEQYLTKLWKNKGELRIDVDDIEAPHSNGRGRGHCKHGDQIKIVSIKLIFKGYTYSKENCTNPPPPPPPPVEDPKAFSPRIDSTNPALSPTAVTSMSISFSATSTGGTFYCSLDGSAPELCVSPKIYQNLTNGAHTFVVSAKTPTGKPAASTASYTWAVDAIAPGVTITNAASLVTLSNVSYINFEFASTKPGSTFMCSLDQSPMAACSSPSPYMGLTEGAHHFEVIAVDALGNSSGTPATFDWVIDATAPTTQIAGVNPETPVSNINTRSIAFSANETATFHCAYNGSGFQLCQSPYELSNMSEGSHVFEVYATDLAGNVGPTVSYTWYTDYTSPVITLGTVVPVQGLTNSKNMSVEFMSDEAVEFFCSVDGATEESCTSPFTHLYETDGIHEIAITAQDFAGNRSNTLVATWTIDTLAPIISFATISPSAAAYVNVSELSFMISGAEGSILNINLNGVSGTSGNPIIIDNLAEGSYTLSVTATDTAGNSSNTITHSFNVDLTAPQITLNNPGANPTNSDSRTLDFSADEQVSMSCELDNAGYSACSSPMILSGLADGSHTFTVRATDLAGNSATAASSWSVDTAAPITILNALQDNKNITFQLSSNESPVTYMCSLDGGAYANCATTVSYSNVAPGTHMFIARATDAAGNTDLLGASHAFTVVAPIETFITATNPTALITNNTAMTISFTASQPASGFMCSLDGAPLASCTSAISFVELFDGPHNFVVRAIDQYGTMDTIGDSHSWIVDTVPPSPSSPPTLTIGVNTILVTWTTNEPATSHLEWGIGGTANINRVTPDDGVYSTNHSVLLSGLTSNTLYSLRVAGHDQAGNDYVGAAVSVRTRR